MKHVDLLVIAAWQPELEELERWLRRERRLTGPRAVACRVIGIGAIDAAVGTTRALLEVSPRTLVYLGTAGAYSVGRSAPARPPAVGEVAVTGELMLVPTGALDNRSYLPTPVDERAPTDTDLRERLAEGGVPILDVACPLGITRSRSLGRRIATATGAPLENLEAFAVARAAAAAGVPFAGVLGVSNRVGPKSHDEWARHGGAAAAAACRLIERMLMAPTRSELQAG